ncbi:MAG: Ig-like domain-containing protein, partial [Gemmatimonadaceae bacterium]|nr:Ig-like domain-containing protein [Gemmatimonadaceae bacterium]
MPSLRWTRVRAIALVATSLAGAACAGSADPVAPPACSVASVALSPSDLALTVGTTRQFSATVANTNCATPPLLAWQSSATGVATVSADGLVTAIAPGVTTIVASAGGVTGQANVTVTPVPVASVEVTLPSPSLVVGASTAATATVRDAFGTILSGRTVTWSSGNPTVATVVSSTGAITALAPGATILRATVDGVEGTRVLTVVPIPVASVEVALTSDSVTVGGAVTATARALNAAGAVLEGRAVQWSSSAPTVATIDAGSGTIVTLTPGTTQIRATVDGVTGSRALTVRPVPVASLQVTLSVDVLVEGEGAVATSVARAANGDVLTGRPTSWSSSVPGVATVDPTSGQVTAVGTGLTLIRALTEGVAHTVPLRVVPAREQDRFAFAWINTPTPPIDEEVTPSLSFLRNASGGSIRYSRRAAGRYDVLFERLAKAGATRNREVVLTTAFGLTAARCTPGAWDDVNVRDLRVTVHCVDASGAPVDTRFTIGVVGSQTLSGAYGFLRNDAPLGGTASTAHAFSSGVGTASVTRIEPGGFHAFTGAASATGSTVFASFFGAPITGRCDVFNWAQQLGRAEIICRAIAGEAYQDHRFLTLMLEAGRAGRRWGYVWNNQLAAPIGVDYVPSPTFARSSAQSTVSIRRQADGV